MKNELNEKKKYTVKKRRKQRTNQYLNEMMNTMCSDTISYPVYNIMQDFINFPVT